MSSAVRVALVGFTKFERATFESFFRLATQRKPAYALTEDLANCEAAVANAEDAAGVAELVRQGKLASSLVLGATPHAGAAQQLARPINLMLVVRALDRLVLSRQTLPVPAEPAVSASVKRVLDDLVMVTTALPTGMDTRAMAASAAPAAPVLLQASTAPANQGWQGLPGLAQVRQAPPPARKAEPETPAAAEAGSACMDHILVVDDSDIALRFMATNLQRFGFQVHLARSGAEAIERVARRHFEFVFMDVMMEGLDGFHTCKAIKRKTYPGNRPPPTVVMLTSRSTAVDKLRGTMAGADAYLTKPLQEAELLKVVGDREVALHAYADTAHAANTVI